MKFGICFGGMGPDEANLKCVHDCKYDYVELSMVDIMNKSDNAFDVLSCRLHADKIQCLVVYLFFPWQLKIVGDEADHEIINTYVERAVKRASLLNVKKIIVGSGTSRLIPTGYCRKKATSEFSNVIRKIHEVACNYEIETIIEPMCSDETNLINTVNDACSFIADMNLSGVTTMIDAFHFEKNKEDYNLIYDCKDLIRHIHVARNDRTFPNKRKDVELLLKFLTEINYDETVSVEAKTKNLCADAKNSLDIMKLFLKD